MIYNNFENGQLNKEIQLPGAKESIFIQNQNEDTKTLVPTVPQ